jgi:hypothetical protein
MLRYKLRTLLIVLAIGPMVLAWWYVLAINYFGPQSIRRAAVYRSDGTWIKVRLDSEGKLIGEKRPSWHMTYKDDRRPILIPAQESDQKSSTDDRP